MKEKMCIILSMTRPQEKKRQLKNCTISGKKEKQPTDANKLTSVTMAKAIVLGKTDLHT